MYSISNNDGYLLVKFIDDFDFPMFQAAIRHESTLRASADTNDIWLFGDNRADICLGEIDAMVQEFQSHCPGDTRRTKTAVVVNDGHTGAIIGLWVKGLKKRVTFEIEIFRTLDKAKAWLEISQRDSVAV